MVKYIVRIFCFALFVSFFFACKCDTGESTIIYLVRHAEKVGKLDSLSEKGVQRTKDLKNTMGQANLDAVFSTKYERTMNTAQPISKALGLTTINYDPSKLTDLVELVKNEYQGKRILIVGHSNTTPSLANLFVPGAELPNISESEYDKLYNIIYNQCCPSALIELGYGASSP
ncbi:MAG: histidine phosphatase family protein [Saprospiraceae bacterium]|nr:histidine phosphatase family protein [Bacteroidia bacterium]NNE13947.1 histidine phosphatase family protein [Saprospiraceae bacterium]NNL93883.1 histidine phosphatase family protein [Saprospiraceae bacterium]